MSRLTLFPPQDSLADEAFTNLGELKHWFGHVSNFSWTSTEGFSLFRSSFASLPCNGFMQPRYMKTAEAEEDKQHGFSSSTHVAKGMSVLQERLRLQKGGRLKKLQTR